MEKEKNLVIVYGQQNVDVVDLNKLNKKRISFGSLEDNDIQIKSPIVSRRHGFLELQGDKCLIHDNNSSNGVYVIGKENSDQELQDGTTMRIDNYNSPHKEGVVMIYTNLPVNGRWSKVKLQRNLTIGRSQECDIRVNHPSVSNIHAEIFLDGNGAWSIKSNTGEMILNGLPFAKSSVHRLCEKDAICIANSKFIYSAGIIIHNADTSGIAFDVRNLSRTVNTKKQPHEILSNVNMSVKPGEFIGIIGSSGSGKTTFLNAACGFQRATSGSVLFNNIDLYQNFDNLKHLIGYVPQHDIIHNALSLKKMLMYTAKIRLSKDLSIEEINDMIENVLATLNLHEKQDSIIGTLSGGQKKRASIAVELLANPSMFFLDEPTTGLDPHIGESIIEILHHLAHEQGKTVLMVTHNTDNIKQCDKVAVFGVGGHLCYFDKPQGLETFFGTKNLTSVYRETTINPKGWENKWRKTA